MPDKEELTADARNRAVRTFIQGLIVTIVIAVVPIVQTAVANGVEKVDWKVLGYAVLTAALMAALSYVWRKFLDPSKVNSLEPPSDE